MWSPKDHGGPPEKATDSDSYRGTEDHMATGPFKWEAGGQTPAP